MITPQARVRAPKRPAVAIPVAAPSVVGTSSAVPGRALRSAGLLTALDGLAVAIYGGWLLVALAVRPRGTAIGVGIFLGVLLLVFAAGIVLAGRSLWRGSRRGRAPALVTHVVLLFTVPGLLAGGSWWLGLPLAVVSGGALVGLFLPSSVRFLSRAPLPGS